MTDPPTTIARSVAALTRFSRQPESTVPRFTLGEATAEFYSRDAWRAGVFGILLLAGGATIRLATSESLPDSLRETYYAELVTCGLVIGYLLGVRRQVHPKWFVALNLILVGSMFVTHALAIVAWTRIGRPFEVFASIRVIILLVALVMPRSWILSLAR